MAGDVLHGPPTLCQLVLSTPVVLNGVGSRIMPPWGHVTISGMSAVVIARGRGKALWLQWVEAWGTAKPAMLLGAPTAQNQQALVSMGLRWRTLNCDVSLWAGATCLSLRSLY